MKTINLINIEKSDIKYELTTFPDGEPHIKLDDIDRKDEYQVICRITNPNELFIVLQVGNILKRQGVIYKLKIYYLMSMRMDRVINFNEAFSLEIVANAINSINPYKVYIFECHSDRAFKLINNSYCLGTSSIIIDNISFNNIIYYNILNCDNNNTAICFPDHGAYERYKCIYSEVNHNIIKMDKVRDLNNKGIIKSMIIDDSIPLEKYDKITIIDDLCDGGGTFCWAASIIREEYMKKFKYVPELNIFVKHIVNSSGLIKLAGTFDNVYITNSYKNWDTFIRENNLKNIHVFNIC